MNTAWVWLRLDVLLAVHEEQLVEHGGPSGVRDQGLLESALARPQQLAAYGEPDASALAAALTWGLAKNHPFVDGNKRTAFVAMELFLLCNGYVLTASDPQCVLTMLAVAAGEMSEEALAKWLRQHIHPR
ncbi:type II toxin-antitoxin system death-on-curing family toxin [Ideonella sp.]|uniref:type II toxin-antitoxin system death-on-curing family toxin n=1 Tax=Ideonella sp. TaxID=1929293 RepID=UPI0037BE844F